MLLSIEKVTYTRANETKARVRRVLHLQCDHCHAEFTKPYNARILRSEAHFCPRPSNCVDLARRSGNTIDIKSRKTKQERYGDENYNNIQRARKTCLERYGAENPFASKEIRDKIVEKYKQRYGYDNPSSSPLVKEKIRNTFIRRYGVDNPMKVPEFRHKHSKTCMKNLSVAFPMQCESVRSKTLKTWMKKYGVTHPLKHADVQRRMRKTFNERYGVDAPMQIQYVKDKFDFALVAQKSHATKKLNGTYGKSSAEDHVYDMLRAVFGYETGAVERQVRMPGLCYTVDFYIAKYDAYVEYDGVYWHGLDLPLHELFRRRHSGSQAMGRLKTYISDRKQDKFADQMGLKFYRIIENDEHSCIMRIVRELKYGEEG